MAILVGSSHAPVKFLYLRPSLCESGSSKSKEHRPSQDRRRVSQLSLRPVNGTKVHMVGPMFCCSSLNPSTSILVNPSSSFTSSAASLIVRLRLLSNFDSSPCISFTSSGFLNSLTSNLVSKMRKRTEKGGVENPGLCRGSIVTNEETEITQDVTEEENIRPEGGGWNGGGNGDGGGGGGGGGGGDAVGWISSALIFGLWAGLLLYAFTLAPDQTQYSDTYFIEKLVGLHSDDGFIMNKVLVAEWYFMGLWPLIYSSLLIPSGRSNSGVKVWPFAVVSFFLGAFALLPYFGLWRPPPPKVSRDELKRYPLNVLESKLTAVAIIIGGIVLGWNAGFAGGDQWAEFLQYFQESRFINVMSIDFLTLSALAPFWVYNDLSARQRSNASSWLPSIAVIPFFGPALYLFLRPPLASSFIDGSEENSRSS
ncbi:unnamed protein product [Calypogeia fissa]